ncbi:hypothetical protein E2C01_091060 [Portunus trituberculatus]|uniref:Uncharacterized protein n=1 Tax=Portunus trituberculatus TaxID=210409 RepID=A0A5B7JI71_PORTR|nr:hypothetical protein [Portunus trituberculatus]
MVCLVTTDQLGPPRQPLRKQLKYAVWEFRVYDGVTFHFTRAIRYNGGDSEEVEAGNSEQSFAPFQSQSASVAPSVIRQRRAAAAIAAVAVAAAPPPLLSAAFET